jgi:hypothetical protein
MQSTLTGKATTALNSWAIKAAEASLDLSAQRLEAPGFAQAALDRHLTASDRWMMLQDESYTPPPANEAEAEERFWVQDQEEHPEYYPQAA